jgi:hypothetical protein
MNDRDFDLKKCRPIITTARITDDMSFDERFQNITLRPIVLQQHDLLILVFRNYIVKHKNVFYDLSLEKRMDYIENTVHKDMKFRNSIKGMIIGLFTLEEYELYITNSSSLNKRLMNIVKERLLSTIQVFERPDVLEAV